jgi:SAM-dependent methyltransferase
MKGKGQERVRKDEGRRNFQKASEYSQKVIRHLYKNNNAKSLSNTYRMETKERHENDSFLTYGEVDSHSFLQILGLVDNFLPLDGKVFYDLGSGSGLACVIAALSPYSFSSVLGIEIVPGLVELSHAILKNLQNCLSNSASNTTKQPQSLQSKKISSEVDFTSTIDSILAESGGKIAMEALANRICKEIGHKQYKAAMKKYSSFLQCIKSHSEKYLLSEDGKEVSRNCTSIEETPALHIDEAADTPEVELSVDNDIAVDDHKPLEERVKEFYRNRLPVIEFTEGDIFLIPWWITADVVYVASLLFSNEMMEQLTRLVYQMKENSVFITLKPLLLVSSEDSTSSDSTERGSKVDVHLVHESFFKMSWQMAKVYIYQVRKTLC